MPRALCPRMTKRPLQSILATLALSACLGTACDSNPPLSDAPLHPASPLAASTTLPELIRQRALAHVHRAAEAGVAPAWRGAELGVARPLHRADVDGVAYWEIAVEGQAGPAGYLILSTGPHDGPIVEWASEGRARTALLDERSGGVIPARYLRVERELAAEADGGAIVATTLAGADATDPEPAWRELEQRALDPSGDYAMELARTATAAWERTTRAEAAGTRAGVARSLVAERSCGVPEAPSYDQLAPGEVGNTWGYYSGCGATAWAMLIGWIDQRAGAGDPKWAGFRGLYRLGGAASSLAPDTVAPSGFDWGPRLMVDQLRKDLGSIGWPGNDQTSTDIYQMGHIGYYLDRVGLDDYLEWPTHHIGGAPWDGLKGNAIGYLCDQQQPAILGIGLGATDLHYALATHYYRDTAGNEWFYLNMGWGGARRWDWPSVFFVGSLVPHGTPPAAPARTAAIEVLEATYGAAGQGAARRNNAVADVSDMCNGRFDCGYRVEVGILGDPQPGVAKRFDVRYRCGAQEKRILLPAEANGQWAILNCPRPRPIVIQPGVLVPDGG
jgi:hypothetical protein